MKVAARVIRRRTFSTLASSARSRWSSSSVSSRLASLRGAIRADSRPIGRVRRGVTLSRVRAPRALMVLAAALFPASCSLASLIPGPTPTEAPVCAPLDDVLGSVQLDYSVAPPTQPDVSAADAERVGRSMMGDEGTTCSVKLARYDNLAHHPP